MRRYLLDTNIVLHYVRGDVLQRFIESVYGLFFAQLVRFLGWGQNKRLEMERPLSAMTQIPIPFGSVVDDYVEIASSCRANGRVLSKNDLWIAAFARATGTRLLTTDRDFEPLAADFLTCKWINPVLPDAP